MANSVKQDSGPKRWLVVMAKEPRCGLVKTRLARDIGSVAATQFYRRTLANVSARLANDPRWNTLIAVSPDTSIGSFAWPHGPDIIGQGEGDLGARMQRILDCLPKGSVVIIGTDIPEISSRHIAKAFSLLGTNDAVLGPCDDGGYWLVGLKRTPRVLDIFADVRWSSAHTLKDTLANLEGMSVAMLEQLSDVDDGKRYWQLDHAASRLLLPALKG
jgi:rSAM/selenodomain-associated transferase 1